jgi:hypothetical protein
VYYTLKSNSNEILNVIFCIEIRWSCSLFANEYNDELKRRILFILNGFWVNSKLSSADGNIGCLEQCLQLCTLNWYSYYKSDILEADQFFTNTIVASEIKLVVCG